MFYPRFFRLIRAIRVRVLTQKLVRRAWAWPLAAER